MAKQNAKHDTCRTDETGKIIDLADMVTEPDDEVVDMSGIELVDGFMEIDSLQYLIMCEHSRNSQLMFQNVEIMKLEGGVAVMRWRYQMLDYQMFIPTEVGDILIERFPNGINVV